MTEAALTLEGALRGAVARAGLSDFGDPWFEQPARAWLTDMPHARLSASGRQALIKALGQDLVKRLQVHDAFARNPAIAEVELPPIILITGYIRSGTTLLHNLMAQHPGARTLRRWELLRPTPPPEAASYASDPRIARVQAGQDTLRGTLLEQMHWINADDPEECTWGAYDCTGIFGRGASLATPTWDQWLRRADLTPSFVEYRKLLQLLLWKCPPPVGGHLLLKCPQTAWNVRQFARVFPEASYVILHRDPYRAITSGATLVRANVQPLVDDAVFEWGQLGPLAVEGAVRCYSELTAFAASRVVHVAYPELMAGADATTRRIYAELQVPCPPRVGERIRDFLASQREGRRAAPPASYDGSDLDAESIWAEPRVAEYMRRFDVQRETQRLTDTTS